MSSSIGGRGPPDSNLCVTQPLLTNEFGFSVAREKARLLRWVAIFCAFIVPLLLCYFTKWFWAASVICMVGLLVERWLFFAEAEHVVRLYHGQQRV